jgi:uncharacterized RDD family membrane protein YckC
VTEPNDAQPPSVPTASPALAGPQIPHQGYAAAPGYPPPGHPPPGYAGPPGYPPPRWRPAWQPVSLSGQPLASFGDRLLAYLVDAAILFGVGMVIGVITVVAVIGVVGWPDDQLSGGELLLLLVSYLGLLVVSMAVTYVYYVEMMFRSGQTVGKRVVRLRVVPLDPVARLDRGMATKRWLVQSVAAIIPFFSYLDGFWQLWDRPFQQCLHDKYAQTVVVKVNP